MTIVAGRNIGLLTSKLMLGTALASCAALSATTAQAQNENVVVTGTTIRGQQPVGANVIAVDRAAIEATGALTTAQLLVTIPQLNNFGSAAQGGENSADGSGTQAPTIHSLGNSASNATLILIDGHRLPLTGTSHSLADPSIIPPAAIASVEVLPDGASAIYGSDAVAGVINFHTRRDYSGWETSMQYGMADSYNTFTASQMFGHSWDDGGVVAVYNYSNRSNLMNRERDYITARQDLRRGAADPSLFIGVPDASTYGATLQTVAPNGQAVPYPSDGGNFQDLTSCPVATISVNTSSSGSVYAYPYSGSAIPRRTSPSGGPSTGICDTLDYESALPSEVRNQGLISIYQALNDSLVLNVDAIYSSRLGSSRSARGGLSNTKVFNPNGGGNTAFGSAGSAEALAFTNPFYVGVPGAATNANAEYVSLDFTELLASQGLGYASSKTGATTAMATAGLDYDIGGDWLISLGGTVGTDFSFSRNVGGLNSSEARLALNGTVSNTGAKVTSPSGSNIADPYGLNTTVSVTRALTTANALDVWNPVGSNQTSAAVLRSLVDSYSESTGRYGFQNLTLHADGPLLDLFGAGDIKAAVGGEYIHYTQDQTQVRNNNAGPNSTTARTLDQDQKRTVYAAYVEIVVPVVSADMGIPLVRNLVFDFAGRYDEYSDAGDTMNPKIAVNWDIVDGLRASASFGTSFTAPALDSSAPTTNVAVGNRGAANGLVVLFNDTRPFNNGAGIAGTWVSNAVACAAAGSTPVEDAAGTTNAPVGGGDYPTAIGCKNVVSGGTGSQGLRIGASAVPGELKPQLGQSYSANLVFDNFGKFWDVLEGLSAQFTYYQAKFSGAVTNIGIVTTNSNYGLPELVTFGPANGCVGLASMCGSGQANEPGWSPTSTFIQDFIGNNPVSNALPTRIYSIQDFKQKNAYNLWQNGIDFKIDYRYATETMGDFTFSVSGNQILRADQQNGVNASLFEAKNGRNGGRFLNVELTGRLSVNWHMEPYTVGLSFNYRHPYNQSNVTVFPYNYPGPNRLADYAHVAALETLDLNLGYNLPDEWLSGTRATLTVRNVLDTDPPYINGEDAFHGPGGNAPATGNVIGRLISIGITKTW